MKKTRLLLIGLLMAICAEGFAQDIIYTLDSRRIEAKVLEITDEDIRYKTFDNLEGPDYRMSLDRVVRIVFENGTEKVFSQVPLFVPNPYEGIGPYGSCGPYGPLSFHWGYYYDRRGRVYEEQLRDYLGVALYGSDYLQARRQYQGGIGLTLGGAALLSFSLVSGAMLEDYNRSSIRMGMGDLGHENTGVTAAILVVGGLAGAAGLAVGIPLWVKGNRKLCALADDYNRRVGQAPSLELGTTNNGVGVALRF